MTISRDSPRDSPRLQAVVLKLRPSPEEHLDWKSQAGTPWKSLRHSLKSLCCRTESQISHFTGESSYSETTGVCAPTGHLEVETFEQLAIQRTSLWPTPTDQHGLKALVPLMLLLLRLTGHFQRYSRVTDMIVVPQSPLTLKGQFTV